LSTDGFEEDERLVGELAEWVSLEELDAIVAGSTINWRRIVKDALGLTADSGMRPVTRSNR